ncbi:MAG: voltage-gated potassium channel [Miltoncostaeaceae bacterium]|nr:voltage-gated potassium channel [Miltoncostaeaceae bacterium]
MALVYGSVGYQVLEGWNFLDSLYMTVTTLTTVGFREVHPLDAGGQVFTLSVVVLGLGTVFAALGTFTELIVSGELARSVGEVRMHKRIDRLRDHFVLCAYGRVGQAAAQEFRDTGVPFVIIDTQETLRPQLEVAGDPFLIADPSRESVLLEAGIDRAKGMVCAVDSDAVNVYMTLTARALNPDLTIVARASNAETVDRLRRAGADRVVSPYDLGGRRMAFLSLRPAVMEFFDLLMVAPDTRLEEILVRPGSALDGRTIQEACAANVGVSILALKKIEGALLASPDPATELGAGDVVVALGPLRALEALAV